MFKLCSGGQEKKFEFLFKWLTHPGLIRKHTTLRARDVNF